MFTTGETVGLAEWIIDDACLVYFVLEQKVKYLTFKSDISGWSRLANAINSKNLCFLTIESLIPL